MSRRLPKSRLGRLGPLAGLATGVAGDLLLNSAKSLGRGEKPKLGEILLTPANARRLADKLAKMRGAAMKVGQLLSMDSGQFLPPEFSEVLARLRDDGQVMSMLDVSKALTRVAGEDWQAQFAHFEFTPIASASIGQVHRARLKDGRQIAIKVQFPGIRKTIDSDVDNVGLLLKWAGVVPTDSDIQALLDEAKLQLHAEADYLLEAAHLQEAAARLAGDARFELPEPLLELSGDDVLCMSFLDGVAIDQIGDESAQHRNAAGAALIELALRELLIWGAVQTDANFANFLYSRERHCLQLLDYGATRVYPEEMRSALAGLLRAGLDGDEAGLVRATADLGYTRDGDSAVYRDGMASLLRLVTEPLRSVEPTDFAATDVAVRVKDLLVDLRVNQKQARIPAISMLFLHRKIGGLYLLLSQLRAVVDVRAVAERVLAE